MRQPSSRGSPRPRGYIHQIICSFISLSVKGLQFCSTQAANLIYTASLWWRYFIAQNAPSFSEGTYTYTKVLKQQ